jgi:formamidopyrimidine-DNA glycosylase
VPELPEVETVVRELRPRLVGRRIDDVTVGRLALRRVWKPAWSRQITGRTVVAADRRGKWILLQLDHGGVLVVHLGMTGQLTVVNRTVSRQNHVHAIFGLDNGMQLRFRDVRRFGSLQLFEDMPALERQLIQVQRLGPEPFDLRATYWRERLTATDRCLKAVLLDQRVVAGVGNIYADESLFEAKLHPARPGRNVTSAEARRLGAAVSKVLRRAIAKRGSSIRDYIGGTGDKGQYQDEFRVYGRTGQPCPRCGRPVERVRLAGRSTHFCSACQPAREH